MPKISVIVPIYGAELYIERCARSLFNQSLDDIEYIFINDCTPDNSLGVLQNVLEDFPHRKQQTKIHHMKENSRQAAVRNEGMDMATGEFVIHCDSDDWVDPQLYELMYLRALKTHSDIVICPVKDEFNNQINVRQYGHLPVDCKQVLENWYQDSIGMFLWNKLVRRSVYIDNRLHFFDNINMWEDNGLMMRLFYYAKGLAVIDNAYYHYNKSNGGAMTNAYGAESVAQMIECASLMESFFKQKPDYFRFEKTVLALKFFARINLITDSFKSLAQYYKIFPESSKIIPFIPRSAFSRKGWIRFCFARYHLEWLFVLFYKLNKNVFHIVIH